MVGGDTIEATYLWYGLASSTRESYHQAVDAYVAFCRVRGWTPPYFPATADRVGVWIAHEARRSVLSGKGLFKKTLKRKLFALLSWHKDLGMATDGVTSPRVERVIVGANRFHGVRVKEQPLTITLPILRKVLEVIRMHPELYGGRVGSLALIAAFTLGFACFMRMGEITYSVFDARFDLCRTSITFGENGNPCLLKIPASKTDVFRQGVVMTVPTGPTEVCPVRALCRYMIATFLRAPTEPLFQLHGRKFPKGTVVGYLGKALREAGYPAQKFTGHSLRRGAATWAASIGMSATDIQTLGRWNSDCYRLYIDAGPNDHLRAGKRLLSATIDDSTLSRSGIPQPGQVWRPAL